jgi:hypothetical protein
VKLWVTIGFTLQVHGGIVSRVILELELGVARLARPALRPPPKKLLQMVIRRTSELIIRIRE